MFQRMMAMLAAFTTVFGLNAAIAGDFGTREEAVAMTERAIAYYDTQGLDALNAAVMDPANADFHDRDLYVFVYDSTGVTLAHGANPKLVGKNLAGLKDQNGVMIIADMLALVAAGKTGWVDYSWPHPETQQLMAKSAYVTGFDNGTKFLGVGVYAE